MIVTDSLSALKALEAQKMDTGSLDILIKIKLFLDSMFSDGFNLMFVWIPAHCNITSNERADSLAKTAALDGTLSDLVLEVTNYLSTFRPQCITT